MRENLDVEGYNVQIGDTVECVQQWESRPTVGTIGEVITIANSTIGVAWQNFHEGHDLSGILLGADINSGWWMNSRCVRVITKDALLDKSAVDALAVLFDTQQATFIVKGNLVIKLTPESIEGQTPLSLFLHDRDADARQLVANTLANLQERKKKLELEYSHKLIMPNISYQDTEEGVHVYLDEGLYGWSLPFVYNPVVCVHEETAREIPEEIQQQLFREVQITITYDPIAQNTKTRLWDITELGERSRFKHYHSAFEADCLGKYRALQGQSARVLKQTRDDIEELFHTVNFNSLGSQHPEGMPKSDDLWDASKPIEKAPHLWGNPFSLGRVVQVIGTPPYFPPNCVGSIGVCYGLNQGKVMVRFSFEDSSFQSMRHRGIYRRVIAFLDPQYLTLPPVGTPRTKLWGVYNRKNKASPSPHSRATIPLPTDIVTAT